jgi:hypothetical protein
MLVSFSFTQVFMLGVQPEVAAKRLALPRGVEKPRHRLLCLWLFMFFLHQSK